MSIRLCTFLYDYRIQVVDPLSRVSSVHVALLRKVFDSFPNTFFFDVKIKGVFSNNELKQYSLHRDNFQTKYTFPFKIYSRPIRLPSYTQSQNQKKPFHSGQQSKPRTYSAALTRNRRFSTLPPFSPTISASFIRAPTRPKPLSRTHTRARALAFSRASFAPLPFGRTRRA